MPCNFLTALRYHRPPPTKRVHYISNHIQVSIRTSYYPTNNRPTRLAASRNSQRKYPGIIRSTSHLFHNLLFLFLPPSGRLYAHRRCYLLSTTFLSCSRCVITSSLSPHPISFCCFHFLRGPLHLFLLIRLPSTTIVFRTTLPSLYSDLIYVALDCIQTFLCSVPVFRNPPCNSLCFVILVSSFSPSFVTSSSIVSWNDDDDVLQATFRLSSVRSDVGRMADSL